MGTWNLEFNPGLTGEIYKMVEFDGDIFAFCYQGTGSGVWRRTPPNWTQTFAGDGRGAVWDGQMWMGNGNSVYRSPDGVNWFLDHSWGAGAFTHWSALNGYGSYLYGAQLNMPGGGGTHFWQRDTAGNWTATPPRYAAELSHSYDIMGYGGYVYWSAAAADVRYYQTAWAYEPTLNNNVVFFLVHGGYLYAAGDSLEVWRRVSGAWSKTLNVGGAWGAYALSLGSDGLLYITGEDGVDSRVYYGNGGSWTLHSTAAGVSFGSAISVNGVLVAGTLSCEFWLYTPDFDVTPVGGGLYPEALGVDADGGSLFVCLYDGAGQPLLVKAPLPLAAGTLGSAVFNPGAGSAINVKCTNIGGRLAVAGRFSAGGNDSVQISEDAAATWVDVAPNWADDAQPLLVSPDSEGEVMVALAGAQDLVETFNRGQDWVTENAAVGYSPGALAKLPLGDEIVVGDDAANQIDYSPNRGRTLQNITGAFTGNVAAIEVV